MFEIKTKRMGDEKEEKERGGYRGIFYNFSQWTSAHGIPHVGSSKHTSLVCFWAVITSCALGLLTWQVIALIIRYLRYDVSVGMELRFERRGFPGVTVCDLNPFMTTAVNAYPGVKDLLDSYQYALDKMTCGGGCVSAEKESGLERFGLNGISDTVALHSKARDLLVMEMSKLPPGTRKNLAPSQNTLIKSCSFNTRDCDLSDDFKPVIDAKMGRCFTFNHQHPSKYTTSRAGPLYGLRMILFTNTTEYLSLTETAGVRVIIHNQTEQPFPDTYGYNVEIGSATSMGVSFKQIKRLGKPYGDCVDTEDLMGAAGVRYLYEGSYTSEGCQRSCFQDMVQQECGCSDPNYPQTDASKYTFCSATNKIQRECWYNLISSNSEKKDPTVSCTQCQLPCKEGVYDVTVSAASWPAKSTLKIADCDEQSKTAISAGGCLKLYRNNGAMVEVFYEQLNYQQLDESPAYEFVNLASDFGGQIGLWLGLSALSIVEFFVLVGQVCSYTCSSRKNAPEKSGKKDDDAPTRTTTGVERIRTAQT